METEMQHIFTRNGAGLVEQLMAKTQFWEQERNKIFYYDEVQAHILQNRTVSFKLINSKFGLQNKSPHSSHSS